MNTKVTTLAALVSSVLVSNVQEVAAQTNPPPSATATRGRSHRNGGASSRLTLNVAATDRFAEC